MYDAGMSPPTPPPSLPGRWWPTRWGTRCMPWRRWSTSWCSMGEHRRGPGGHRGAAGPVCGAVRPGPADDGAPPAGDAAHPADSGVDVQAYQGDGKARPGGHGNEEGGGVLRPAQALRGNHRLLVGLYVGMFLELTALFAVPCFSTSGLGLSGTSWVDLLLTQCLVMVISRIVLLPGNVGGAEGCFTCLWGLSLGSTWRLAWCCGVSPPFWR